MSDRLNAFGKGKSISMLQSKIAVAYTRVSTKEQADNNQSLNTQANQILIYAKKTGIEIVKSFGGTYESAKTDERIEFKEMMDYDSNGTPQRSFYMNLESDLKNIRDLERLHRRIAMGTLTPMEISSIIISYKAIQNLYNSLYFKINSSLNNSKNSKRTES